jgi:hypothetical protein
MNITNEDCLYVIRSFLTWPESCCMSIVFRMAPDYKLKRTYESSVIVRSTVRRFASSKAIMKLFVAKCVNDLGYRSKYLFIHQTENPHICFRNTPRWLSKNPYRFHIRTFLTEDIENMIHTYISTIMEISTI